MLNLVKIISNEIDSLNRRVLKFLRYGDSDVQTSRECMPFGVDAVPIKDLIAIYAETGKKGETVIIGYINKNQLAGVGEHRIYSTNANGVEQFFIWLKNNGTCEIGGNTDFMVRFNELKAGFDQLKTDFNAHIHTGNLGAPTSAPTIPSTASIDGSKINEIKTLG